MPWHAVTSNVLGVFTMVRHSVSSGSDTPSLFGFPWLSRRVSLCWTETSQQLKSVRAMHVGSCVNAGRSFRRSSPIRFSCCPSGGYPAVFRIMWTTCSTRCRPIPDVRCGLVRSRGPLQNNNASMSPLTPCPRSTRMFSRPMNSRWTGTWWSAGWRSHRTG